MTIHTSVCWKKTAHSADRTTQTTGSCCCCC